MNKNLLSVIFIFCMLQIHAQDPSFSQFYANRIYLNPAFAGIESGISFSGITRTQWANVDSGFQTHIASVEFQQPFLRSGLSMSIVVPDAQTVVGLC